MVRQELANWPQSTNSAQEDVHDCHNDKLFVCGQAQMKENVENAAMDANAVLNKENGSDSDDLGARGFMNEAWLELELDVTLGIAQSSGASAGRASKPRSLPEDKKRSRWMRETRLRRYVTRARLNASRHTPTGRQRAKVPSCGRALPNAVVTDKAPILPLEKLENSPAHTGQQDSRSWILAVHAAMENIVFAASGSV